MSYQYVNVEVIRKVAVIEFNYSRKLNALSKVFIDDLMQALSDLNRPEIRCVILRAPGGSKVFSAGHDIHELPGGRRDPLSYDDPLRQITRMIQKYPKPVISMVEGSVWGGAFEMIMSSDLIIAASTSTFSMTPVNLGVPYNLVGIHNLTRDAGFHIVKELIFTALPHHRPARAGGRHSQSRGGRRRTGRFYLADGAPHLRESAAGYRGH